MGHPIHPPRDRVPRTRADAIADYEFFLLLARDLRETWRLSWAGSDHLAPDLYMAERRAGVPEHTRAVGVCSRVAARDVREFAARLRKQESLDWSLGFHPDARAGRPRGTGA